MAIPSRTTVTIDCVAPKTSCNRRSARLVPRTTVPAIPGLGDLGGLLGGLQNPGPSTGKSPTSTDQQSGGGLFGLLGALLGGGRQ